MIAVQVAAVFVSVALLYLLIRKEIRTMTATTKTSLENLASRVSALESVVASNATVPDDVAPVVDALAARVQAVTDSLTPKP